MYAAAPAPGRACPREVARCDVRSDNSTRSLAIPRCKSTCLRRIRSPDTNSSCSSLGSVDRRCSNAFHFRLNFVRSSMFLKACVASGRRIIPGLLVSFLSASVFLYYLARYLLPASSDGRYVLADDELGWESEVCQGW